MVADRLACVLSSSSGVSLPAPAISIGCISSSMPSIEAGGHIRRLPLDPGQARLAAWPAAGHGPSAADADAVSALTPTNRSPSPADSKDRGDCGFRIMYSCLDFAFVALPIWAAQRRDSSATNSPSP